MGRCLVLTSNWSEDLLSVVEKENVSVLRLSESAGWKGNDISFLNRLSSLKGVEVYSWSVKDLTPIRALGHIEYLGLQCKPTNAIDIGGFVKLETCKIFWYPKATTVFDCQNLTSLNVVNYPDEDLGNLESMRKLQRLQLTSRKLTSLSGVEHLTLLSTLDIAGCVKLESLTGLSACERLETIEIEGSKKIRDISSLGELRALRKLFLIDCGEIDTLLPLVNCKLLESIVFVGDTVVKDGMLTPLLGLPNLKTMQFADRAHYSHRRDQIIDVLN